MFIYFALQFNVNKCMYLDNYQYNLQDLEKYYSTVYIAIVRFVPCDNCEPANKFNFKC